MMLAPSPNGVGNDDVDARSHDLSDLFGKRSGTVGGREVSRQNVGTAAGGVDFGEKRARLRCAAPVVDDYPRPGIRERAGRGTPDAPGCAGNECYLVGIVSHSGCFSC